MRRKIDRVSFSPTAGARTAGAPRRRKRDLVYFSLLLLVACAREPGETSAPPVSSHVERGPVAMTVRAEPGAVTAGQKLTLTIEAAAPAGVDITMPQLEAELGTFAVRGARTPPDVPDGDRRRTVHVYTLDTFATGQIEVPSLSLRFVDARGSGEPSDGTLQSQALAVSVGSNLAGDEKVRDIRGMVDVPGGGAHWMWWIALAAVVAAAAAAVLAFLVGRRRRAAEAAAEPEPLPHAWAMAALAQLEADGLLDRGAFEPFYTRLSDIVRQYIEKRFGLMAPERTTDEFLVEARRGDALSEGHKTLLEGFLRAADMVKFARFQPRSRDATEALGAARGFVQETAPVEGFAEAAA